MSGARFELRLGAPVIGTDGAVGWIDALLASPGSGEISGLVLSDGPLFNRGITVPIEAVERTEDGRVHVWLSAAQLDGLAEIRARGSTGPPATDERRIEAQRRVIGRDSEIGSLALVLVDPTSDRVTDLVVRRGDVDGRDTIVPMAWVQELTSNPIVLDASSDQLDSLPDYRPDNDVTGAVSSLLWNRADFPPSDRRYVRVRNGAIDRRVPSMRGVPGADELQRAFDAVAAASQALRQQGQAPGGPWRDQPAPALLPWEGVGSEYDAHARLDYVVSGSVPAAGLTRPVETAA